MADELEKGVLLNGRYRIVRALGRGGMGTVYLAEHVRLDMPIAVKEVRGHHASELEHQLALEQCDQEARFLVRLNHPNLPKVMDAFSEEDRFYLVMEYIEGVTLEAKIKEAEGAGIPIAQVVEWGLQIADVLAYLHSQQPPIIFRDLKPANIMVQPDENIRLIDFGIARRFNPEAQKDTALLGSVGYSPPEQFGRHQTDTRSDIYAFGATLHHLATGRDPANQPFKFPPAAHLNPSIPQPLSQLLDHCLAMDIEARPATIHEVALAMLSVRDALGERSRQEANSNIPAAPMEPLPPVIHHPKITSVKLAEAEANRRRTSGREISKKPGAAPPPPRRSWVWPVVLFVLVAGGTGAVIFRQARKHVGFTAAPVLPVVNLPPPTNSAPPLEAIPAVPIPKPEDRSAEIHAEPQGIMQDEAGGTLRLHAIGRVKGQANTSGVVAAFFYDGDDKPLLAVDPHSVYANTNGQLSVAHSLQVTSDDQPLDLNLDVPLSQFPRGGDGNAVKFRCIVFLEGVRAGESEMTVLPFTLPANVPPPVRPNATGIRPIH